MHIKLGNIKHRSFVEGVIAEESITIIFPRMSKDKNTYNNTVNNSPYGDEELEYFKELLLKEQEETNREIDELKEGIAGLDDQRDDTNSSQDHHIGDLGTEEERKETNYTLIDRNLDKLEEINAALDRIQNGSYGICDATGKKIAKERLEAIPYTRYSVQAQENRDEDDPGPIGFERDF